MEDNNSFLGRGWGFPISFSENSATVGMVENETDIEQSLKILLSTMKRERVLLPDYGVDLKEMIFEPLSTSTATILTEKIGHAILFHEPRIILDGITYDQNVNEGLIIIRIEYTIVATNTRTNVVFPFYFIEGTDLEQ